MSQLEEHLFRFLVGLLVLIGSSGSALAAGGTALDLQTRHGRYHTTISVNKDGAAVESREWSMTVLKEAAVERAKRASVGYSTSAQKIEVVAAYTMKASGRRIDVPKDNYQVEVNRGRGKDSPVYSDRTTLTVVFPDVAIGDSVVFAYRLTQTEPLFPGHFSISQAFPKTIAYDDVRVRIEYPASMWAQYEARGMREVERAEKNGRKVVEWRYANPQPQKSRRRNFSVYDPDKEVGFAFSTFKTYADIAAAYGARAIPKAAVTERISAIAAEIVKDKASPLDQASALYEWVAKNITYAGNCIGIGAVVPRDLSFVLGNRMGDCKDHATLLQGLLASRGIKSTQALVNSGSVYRLQKIPVVSAVNHVINYIPSLDLYVDSTSSWTPFGMLPYSVQDKPVLLVEGAKGGERTPVPPLGANRQQIRSRLKISQNGSIAGTIEVHQKGQSAVQTRAWARAMTKDAEEDFVKDMFRGQGMIGRGKMEKDDPADLADTYRYKIDLVLEKFTKLPGAGAFYIYPLVGAKSIQNVLQREIELEEEEIACTGGLLVEEYEIELPKTVKVLSVPDNMKGADSFLEYRAAYELKGNVLAVRRSLDDRTRGNVCGPEQLAEYKKFSEKVMDNLREQVLYK